ncbi:MAG: glutamate/cysteine ligase family protein [Frankiales bacterium]|nr:glutamate/cysteine ligase family protein [Frankiales bacterium]
MSARVRTRDDVAAHVDAAVRYATPGTVGAELELLCVDRAAPGVRPPLDRVAALLPGSLPGGSLLTTEPGGQVELSSAPAVGAAAAVRRLAEDLAVVRRALDADGISLVGQGTDPLRPPVRLLRTPRYDCMEAYFAAAGEPSASAGPAMMCSTAAVQVSLDAGTRADAAERWQRAHAIGPALVAAFASSPLLDGRATGWRSTRQRIWGALDPSRTCAPDPSLGPVEALTELALTASLLAVRDADGVCRAAPRGLTFGRWMREGAPTEADLGYHLTTLFPPVRLRGWLELRYLDMLPDPHWRVAVLTAAALLDDPVAADAARAACAPVEGRWADAARLGVTDPELQRAAVGCLTAVGSPVVDAYVERWTARGRSPADDLLDAHTAGRPPEELLLGLVEVAA